MNGTALNITIGTRVSYSDTTTELKTGTLVESRELLFGDDEYRVRWDDGTETTTTRTVLELDNDRDESASGYRVLEATPDHVRNGGDSGAYVSIACRSKGYPSFVTGAITVSDPAVHAAVAYAEPATWADVREGDVLLVVNPSYHRGPVNGFRAARVEKVFNTATSRRSSYGTFVNFRYVGDESGHTFNGTVGGNGEGFAGMHRIARGLAPIEDGGRERLERALEEARDGLARAIERGDSDGQLDYYRRRLHGVETGLARR